MTKIHRNEKNNLTGKKCIQQCYNIKQKNAIEQQLSNIHPTHPFSDNQHVTFTRSFISFEILEHQIDDCGKSYKRQTLFHSRIPH